MAFAACCFGSISVLTVLATGAGTPLPTLLFWRYALATLALLPVAWRAGPAARPRGAEVRRALLPAGLGQAAVAFLALSGLRWVTAATAGFLFYTFPAWVALFAALRGSERVDARRVLALALSLGGTVLTVGAPSTEGGLARTWPGVAFVLAGALTYALYIPYLARLQATLGAPWTTVTVSAGAALLFAAGAASQGTLTARLPATSWGAALTLALLCTVVAFQAFLRGLAGLGPVRTAIVSTVEPFFTVLLGAAVLAQPVTPAALAGGALIAAAVLLLQLPPRTRAEAA